MQIDILPYTKERIPDVINFEENLRKQEDFWGWKIDQAYRENVEKSFCSPNFLIQSRCLPMSKARWSAESTPV